MLPSNNYAGKTSAVTTESSQDPLPNIALSTTSHHQDALVTRPRPIAQHVSQQTAPPHTTAALARPAHPNPARVHSAAPQETARPPRSTLLHALARRAQPRLQPALRGAQRVPHTPEIPTPRGREEGHVRGGLRARHHRRPAPPGLPHRGRRHALTRVVAASPPSVRGAAGAGARALPEEIQPRARGDGADPAAEDGGSGDVDAS